MACVSTMQCPGLMCCIPLYCCDTTSASSTCFSINLTWKAAWLCPFVGVLWRVLKVEFCMTDTGGAQLTPLLQCKDSPFGPSAWIEHPWTTAVTPWEKRPVVPVANWSASSRTNSNKEILVRYRKRIFSAFILDSLTLTLPSVTIVLFANFPLCAEKYRTHYFVAYPNWTFLTVNASQFHASIPCQQ